MDRQIRTLRESAAAVPAFGHDAQERAEAEDLVGIALALWRTLNDRLAGREPADSIDAEASRARAHAVTFELFRDLFAAVERTATDLAGRGLSVDGIDDLRAASREVHFALSVPLEKVILSHRQAREGRVKSLGEVRRELQARLHD